MTTVTIDFPVTTPAGLLGVARAYEVALSINGNPHGISAPTDQPPFITKVSELRSPPTFGWFLLSWIVEVRRPRYGRRRDFQRLIGSICARSYTLPRL